MGPAAQHQCHECRGPPPHSRGGVSAGLALLATWHRSGFSVQRASAFCAPPLSFSWVLQAAAWRLFSGSPASVVHGEAHCPTHGSSTRRTEGRVSPRKNSRFPLGGGHFCRFCGRSPCGRQAWSWAICGAFLMFPSTLGSVWKGS